MVDEKQGQPTEDAKVLIGCFKELMKDKTIEIRCPANKTLFCKFLVSRQLMEYLCRKCTLKWRLLTKSTDVTVYHRFTIKGELVETVIVEKGKERVLDKIKKKD